MSDFLRPHRWQPSRLRRPWDSPGKNIGVGCHFFLQCMKVKVRLNLLSCVRLFVAPWTAAHQDLPSMGFSRQEYWTGVPLPSPSRREFEQTPGDREGQGRIAFCHGVADSDMPWRLNNINSAFFLLPSSYLRGQGSVFSGLAIPSNPPSQARMA